MLPVYTVKALAKDRWKAVASDTKWLRASVSTDADPRGAVIGLAWRPPSGLTLDPLAMHTAIGNDEFAKDLTKLLASWGVLR